MQSDLSLKVSPQVAEGTISKLQPLADLQPESRVTSPVPPQTPGAFFSIVGVSVLWICSVCITVVEILALSFESYGAELLSDNLNLVSPALSKLVYFTILLPVIEFSVVTSFVSDHSH